MADSVQFGIDDVQQLTHEACAISKRVFGRRYAITRLVRAYELQMRQKLGSVMRAMRDGSAAESKDKEERERILAVCKRYSLMAMCRNAAGHDRLLTLQAINTWRISSYYPSTTVRRSCTDDAWLVRSKQFLRSELSHPRLEPTNSPSRWHSDDKPSESPPQHWLQLPPSGDAPVVESFSPSSSPSTLRTRVASDPLPVHRSHLDHLASSPSKPPSRSPQVLDTPRMLTPALTM